VIFYLMTVFALSWGTTALGYAREHAKMPRFTDINVRAGPAMATRYRKSEEENAAAAPFNFACRGTAVVTIF
jgi:hypothetical protein